MAVMDEFKEERERMKSRPFKDRLSYFWMYYKWYVIGGTIGVIAIVATVISMVNQKDTALYGVVVNTIPKQEKDTVVEGFYEYAGIDSEDATVYMNTTLQIADGYSDVTKSATELIMVYSMAKDLDLCIMDTVYFNQYAYNDFYLPVTEYLSEEMLEKTEGKLFYIDRAVVEEIDNLSENGGDLSGITYPDPFKPEEMEQPVAVGIDISDCKLFDENYYYADGVAYFGIVANTERLDTSVKFIEYLFEEQK